METAFGDTRFPETAKKLLNQLRSKQLSLLEFLAECAYWALKDGFDELKPKQDPTPPYSQAFKEYMSLVPEKRTKVDPGFFTNNPEILVYYQQKLKVKWDNKFTRDWLLEMLNYIPETDQSLKDRISERLKEFDAARELPEEARQALDTFGGRLVW